MVFCCNWQVLLTTALRTGGKDNLSRLDLDLWPTTLTYNPNLALVNVISHNKIKFQINIFKHGSMDRRTETIISLGDTRLILKQTDIVVSPLADDFQTCNVLYICYTIYMISNMLHETVTFFPLTSEVISLSSNPTGAIPWTNMAIMYITICTNVTQYVKNGLKKK